MKASRDKSDVPLAFRTPAIAAFIALVMLAITLNWVAWEPTSLSIRRGLRQIGYGALLMLLIAYAYWPRQSFLDRRWFKMKYWLAWHIAASYMALGLALIHSVGRSSGSLTFWMMLLFWTVIVSGLAGYFGQKVCYRVLSLIVDHEVGPAGLDDQRQRLLDEFTERHSPDPPAAETAHEHFLCAVRKYLESDWKSCAWLFTREAYEPVSANLHEHARKLANQEARANIDTFWSQVQRRRELDIERVFHRAARCWLKAHRIAAVVLLLLVIAHVVSNIRFGGW